METLICIDLTRQKLTIFVDRTNILVCKLNNPPPTLQATSQLVNAIKCQAETHPDSEMQKKLLAAAKMLADATASMVEAAKVRAHLLPVWCH